jgi:putative ABC transport system substrate-binding protein
MQFDQLTRREFITLGGMVAGWSLAAWAQQASRAPVIGVLGSATPYLWATRLTAFRQGLGETGFIEGQNIAIEYRWAEGQYDQLPALASELVHRQVTVIATGSVPGVRAAKAATTTIPIVFTTASDPVKLGFVASLNRPGGNLTGVTNLGVEAGPKRLELLHELLPTRNMIALLVNPTNPVAGAVTREARDAAQSLGLQLHVLPASTEDDFDTAFATLAKLHVGGLVVGNDGFFGSRSKQLGALSMRYAIPTIWESREFVAAGGLMSYGGSVTELFRVAGGYTGRILKGENPADLPIQQSTKIELFLNLKTAKALGLDVPPTLIVRADEVIE